MFEPVQLTDAYKKVKENMAKAAHRSGRRASDVVLCAVTKTATLDQIKHLIGLGHCDFGENRVVQLAERVSAIQDYLLAQRIQSGSRTAELPKVRWHMIGHLQRNKVKQVVPLVQLIHSVDTLRVAEELQALAARTDRTIDILLQVNASGEETKFGVAAPAVIHLAEQIDSMVHLRLRGLMTMAPYSDDPENARPVFARTAEFFQDIKKAKVGGDTFNILSMGMSGDYQVAIEEGANLVRVGTALFGKVEQA